MMQSWHRKGDEVNADALITQGWEPWLPNAEARVLDVLQLLDVPTTGTFQLADLTILFDRISGHLEGSSLWAYTVLNRDEAKRVHYARFASLVEMQTWVLESFSDRPVYFATARDNRVDRWSDAREVGTDVLVGALNFLLDVKSASPRIQHAVQQAAVDAAVREGAEASV